MVYQELHRMLCLYKALTINTSHSVHRAACRFIFTKMHYIQIFTVVLHHSDNMNQHDPVDMLMFLRSVLAPELKKALLVFSRAHTGYCFSLALSCMESQRPTFTSLLSLTNALFNKDQRGQRRVTETKETHQQKESD